MTSTTLYLSIGIAIVVCTAIAFSVDRVRTGNVGRRQAMLKELGISNRKTKVVGFFHPYCNAGGGGERVLWVAIAALQRKEPDIVSVVYSGDTNVTKEDIIAKVKARFDIQLSPKSLHFVFLQSRHLVEDAAWPRFTLLGQSIGSMCLAWEAMNKLIPDLFIDTMGYAFSFHVVSWVGGIPVGAYVHYPTISTNMLSRVRSRTQSYANSDSISSSAILSSGKLLYYRFFMYYYAASLRQARFIMVNSSWTKSHVDSILQHTDVILDAVHLIPNIIIPMMTPYSRDAPPASARVVYPPCNTREMAKFPLENRERVILSVAQFRPEKDHAAQLRAFKVLLQSHPEYSNSGKRRLRLVLLGGSRNAEDAARIDALRKLAKELEIEKQVEFIVNASYAEVLKWLSRASIGISTMVDEHFGINVVDFMAAGVIPVVHASGGPLEDIVVPFKDQPTGFHATSSETYADALHEALTLSPQAELAMRQRAREWAIQRFSEEEFEKGWDASGWKKCLPAI